MYAADELYDTAELEDPIWDDARDECVDDGDGGCETHGGVFMSFDEDCSVVYAETVAR